MTEDPTRWNFAKVEGLGNDFIVLGAPEGPRLELATETAVALCDRRRGIGGDGVLLLSSSATGDVRMEVINSDGSRPEMCGNGLRCVVALLAQRATRGARLRIETDAGLLEGTVETDGRIRTEMGRLHLTHPEVDVDPLGLGVGWSAGNPHLLVFPGRDLEAAADTFGEAWSHHAAFPDGANVGFWREEADEWRGVVHERGAGRTLACGTGAAAAAAEIMRRRGGGFGRLALRLPGGGLTAEVESSGEEALVALIGEARVRFEGTWRAT